MTNKYFTKAVNIVNKKGGSMISLESDYINSHHNLDVKCNDNHLFKICLNNIKKDRWCPHCSSRKMERFTKELVQTITNKKFIKIRPNWLKNNEGNNLELDMYCEELKLAIEYNGIQHYEFKKFFHKNETNFQKRLADDKLKAQLCTNNKIDLIVVPYTVKDIKKYIVDELNKRSIQLNNLDKDIVIKNEMMQNLIAKVAENNGTLLTSNAIDRDDTVEIRCSLNHVWKTRAVKILSGSWCHTCGLIVTDITKDKISTKIKEFLQTEEGKINKKQSHEKRSQTMRERKLAKIIELTEKTCKGNNSCGLTKPIYEFNKRHAASDGYNAMCKICVGINKQIYKTNQCKINNDPELLTAKNLPDG